MLAKPRTHSYLDSMHIFQMILTNLRRHRVRTLIGAAGIALGVATMLSVVGLLG